MKRLSDAQLITAAGRDPRAFRELYERYAARVHAFHFGRSRDEDAAHDLTAETFAQAWCSRERFRDEADGSAGPWLFGIARHVLFASVRRRRLERSASARLGIVEALERPALVEPDESWLTGLDAALGDLPEGQRQAVHLRVVEDLDYERIAERLDTTAGAARVRVYRGFAALRAQMTSPKEARS
jgi:RNA polymerase sigma factor (sigma-70 family)